MLPRYGTHCATILVEETFDTLTVVLIALVALTGQDLDVWHFWETYMVAHIRLEKS